MRAERSAIWEFLSAQIDSLEQIETFGAVRDWRRITDPESYEIYAPKGKLPFSDYSPWFVGKRSFLIATWSMFELPVPAGVLNRMTCNEIWLDGIAERNLVEFLSDNFGDNPLGKKKYDGDLDAWIWGEGLNEKPDRRDLLRAAILGEDTSKVSFIRMFMV